MKKYSYVFKEDVFTIYFSIIRLIDVKSLRRVGVKFR
jgi:hypothetical protein